MQTFTPDDLIACYRRGVFPMAETHDGDGLFLVDPAERGVLPLEGFHVPRRLARTVRRDPFRISIDAAFGEVIRQCARVTPGRRETWINADILTLYDELHRRGVAHSVECWTGQELVGGLYGVSLGGAFFGESMFSRASDASKVALVHLVARLRVGGYRLLDAQFHNDHLDQFGIQTIPRDSFRMRLRAALAASGNFAAMSADTPGAQVLQSIAQTS